MIIPLGTDRPLARSTLVTFVLIGLNVVAFLGQMIADRFAPEAYQRILHSQLMVWGSHFHWWTLITSAFIHGGLLHLAGNMVFLWVFGPNIEDRFGKVWYLVFYLLGAAASGGLHAIFESSPALGASGAIAALTGAYMVLFPRANVKVFLIFLVIGFYNVPAWLFIGLSVAWDIFSQGLAKDGTAHLAHLGGYAFGFIVGMTLLWLRILPRETYDLFTMARQANRRRQIRGASQAAQRQVEEHWSRKGASPEQLREAEALAAARADVVARLNSADLSGAGAAYKRLADTYPGQAGNTTLSRRYQYDLANYFYQSNDHNAAVYAYERFLEAYPKDAEAGRIRLLLGLIHAPSLNDPVKAKQLIQDSLKNLDQSSADLARRELEALG